MNDVQNAGSTESLHDMIVDMVYQTDADVFVRQLSAMSPEFYGEQQVQSLAAAQSFSQRLLSCKQAGGQYRFTAEGSCAWVHAAFETLERDEHRDALGAEFDSDVFALGAQWAFGEHWFAGVGGSYENITGEGHGGAFNSDGKSIYAGAALKYQPGAWKLSSVLSYGTNDTDTSRNSFVMDSYVAEASRDSDVIGLEFAGSYDFEYSWGYLRPVLALGAYRQDTDDLVEEGAGAFGLTVEGDTQTYTWVRPSVEAGYEHVFANASLARLYGRLGYQQYLGEDTVEVNAGLVGVDLPVNPIAGEVDLGQGAIQGLLGVDYFLNEDMVLQFQYHFEEADRLKFQGGQLKFSYRF